VGFYADCIRQESGTLGRWHHKGPPWLVSLLDFKSCAAWHIDVLLAVPLVIILALLAARRLGWISLHPCEIVFFVVCLGFVPLYFLAWWEPGTRVGTLLTGTTYFTFPATVLFVIGVVRLFRRRAGSTLSAAVLASVLILALVGHGCVHILSYTGIQ
jgi:hypothetical protein